ncbi:hypothetical protein CH370_19440 [Leptospira kmetyi]|uniref:Uncharacterized protein n=2 Tax=Leptospira kmetyi TaxID=408139 RepID=A0A2M9XKH8_9LEPT|nr:hypothetical protein EFP84_04970 [Leptospira kmetyi]EQA51662.1 hypothetical protein LEP1GSC052_0562 [Leptospira kmetyi serovar Malaysia str. Bejo-Iso9]PJZ29553.1 hypothetical protein CH378_12155 [Leptospira kmetyi]PJZ39783.1 hypothetical protein CH370_19440 [Leptospira kmetyi]TGK19163.1 hypothetical protein EHO62_06700 [Leptospira kmetyi]
MDDKIPGVGNSETMKFYFLLPVLLTIGPLHSMETNPWSLSIFERIINRKHVSHIVIETRADHTRVTLLLNERYPYNYKSRSGSFFIRVHDEKEALEISEKLDRYLESGWNLKIYLSGSEITRYDLDKTIQ